MGIYRGPGGTGDATADTSNQSEIAVTKAAEAAASASAAATSASSALAAQIAAQAAQSAAEVAKTAAESAETNAELAETNAETAETNAEAAQLAAEVAQAAAEIAETNAETAETNAETAETNAEAAQLAAESAQTAAELAETNAETAETNAETAETAAEAAQAAAEIAQTAAEQAEINAETAETNAEAAQVAAEIAQTAAELAETNAETAETNAEAAQSAAEAAQLAAEAAQTAAETAETNAETAETNAEAAQLAAEAAQAAAELVYDNFDDRYLGAKNADPTLDNDGDALLTGALYFNTSVNKMKIYSGTVWSVAYVPSTDFLQVTNNLSDLNNAATARTNLGLGTAATTASTDYAPAAKGVTNGDSHDHNGGDGGQIAYSSLSGLPSLGTISSQAANNVSITGGSITGITDLAIADGGTGASTAANARVNLLPSYATNGSKILAVNSGATDVEWITNTVGTVTSVDISVPTGLSVSGNPITTNGTLAISLASGYSIPTTAKQTEWDTAYTDRLKWDGGSTGLTASTGRTSLGASTVGSNIFTLTNPSAITFIRMNADNTVTARSAADFKSDLSLNNVENTALSTWAGSTNITTVGTVATGTISGGTY